MATWKPDPTFYPSARMAMQAPPEKLAYVAILNVEGDQPDALGVVDLDPQSTDVWHGHQSHPRCRTRAMSCITSAGTRAARRCARTRRIRMSSGAT